MSSDTTPTGGPAGAPEPETLGFAGCIAELDGIIRGLETDSVDVDHLAATVEHAAELVEWCRAKLGDTRMRLDEVLPRLELADDDPGEDLDAGGETGATGQPE